MACWFYFDELIFYFVRMAKQIGLFKITGRFGGICFYCMDGMYYAREKSSLTGDRVKHDIAFVETMRYAKRMGDVSKIASRIYKQTVPTHERSRERFREVVGMVMKELSKDACGASLALG